MGLAIALGLRRLRGWHRAGWHKLTGRWPRSKRKAGLGWDGGRPCTSGEMKASLRLIKSRSEEHTSELQSHSDLVCRLLLEKKKKRNKTRDGLIRVRNIRALNRIFYTRINHAYN